MFNMVINTLLANFLPSLWNIYLRKIFQLLIFILLKPGCFARCDLMVPVLSILFPDKKLKRLSLVYKLSAYKMYPFSRSSSATLEDRCTSLTNIRFNSANSGLTLTFSLAKANEFHKCQNSSHKVRALPQFLNDVWNVLFKRVFLFRVVAPHPKK